MEEIKPKQNSKFDEKPRIIKGPADLQRLRLEKLMKNPDKPVIIPERPKTKNMPSAPDFVRNVMGSSAGAGSGEFHVYRHLRRKEYARQKFIQEKSEKEILDEEYHNKIEQNRLALEQKTAKKRQKRMKKREKAKQRDKKPKIKSKQESQSEGEASEEDEEDDEQLKEETTDTDTKPIGSKDDGEIKQEVDDTNQTIEAVKRTK